jgi:hypothetical protein
MLFCFQKTYSQMRKLLLLPLLLTLSSLVSAQESSYDYHLALAQTQFDRSDYLQAAETLQATFAWRSPRSEELLLALRSWTMANRHKEALAVLDHGINSGWLTLDQVLSDELLSPLHPSKEWQALIQKLIRFSNGTQPELRDRMATLLERDQYYRQQMQTIASEKGWEDPAIKEMYDLQQELDAINLQEVEGIIAEVGYPGRSLVGNLSTTALYIIQRADLATQEKYLPMLEGAAKSHEILRSELAYLIDKIRMAKEEPQVYGTQIIRNSNGMLDFYRIEAAETVNDRRYQKGLLPIEEYAEKVGVQWTK